MTTTNGSVIGPNDPGYDGQRHYTSSFLRIYDPIVLGFFTRVVWRCPTPHVTSLYSRHTGRRHLDVGPGTGFFLERAPATERLVLLDPNLEVLAFAADRLADRSPATLAADVRVPIPIEERFDSAALSFVLHCLPGPMDAKAVAIENVAALLEPDGVLFGGTVLGDDRLHNAFSSSMLRMNNRRGIFDNLDDTEAGLRRILGASFDTVQVDVVGALHRPKPVKLHRRWSPSLPRIDQSAHGGPGSYAWTSLMPSSDTTTT
jgi:SAM-dependent methyltransferase